MLLRCRCPFADRMHCFFLQNDHLYGLLMNHKKFAILFRKEPKWCINTEIAHIWKAYLTLEIVKKKQMSKI